VAVTPRINAGGLVTMDIQAEVSNPGDVANAGDAPPINTRSLQSIVAVQSGDTLIMGGLIRDTKQQGSEGIPWLTKIPVIGGLFGQQNIKDQRSELVLFVTPRVVETQQDVRNILDELGKRMERLQDVFPKRIGDPADVPPPSRLMTSPPARRRCSRGRCRSRRPRPPPGDRPDAGAAGRRRSAPSRRAAPARRPPCVAADAAARGRATACLCFDRTKAAPSGRARPAPEKTCTFGVGLRRH
jgi:hypothetical protein